MSNSIDDKGYFRRKYPRRSLKRKVGIICRGTFFMCDSEELGEGGISIYSDTVLSDGSDLVVSFQIPGGDFVSLRAIDKATTKKQGQVTHGLALTAIQFAHKRQIRSFVSSRTNLQTVAS